MRTSKLLQPTNDDPFRSPHQDKANNHLHLRTIMQSQNKNDLFTFFSEYHTLLRKAGLKIAPDKTFFFLDKDKFIGHVLSPEEVQPIAKRVKDLKNLKPPERKRHLNKVLGCLGFNSCYIKNLHVDSQPFYDLIKD